MHWSSALPADPAASDARWERRGLLACLALLLGLCGLAFFRGMRSRPIVLWDEGRVAANAAEMLRSGQWLVTLYEGRPDLWNTKPPLLVWMQAALLHTGLSGEVAVRLPSAAAATAVVLGLLLFCHIFLRDTTAGLASALVLVGSPGFAGLHVARTGDYDALLVFFVTAYLLAYFVYLEGSPARRAGALAVFWVAVLGAVLTKNIAGLIGCPALAAYTLATGQLRRVLTDRRIYLGAAAVVAAVATFVVLRERAAPGYVRAMLTNDITGRYLDVIERHAGGPGFYLRGLVDGRFAPWVYLLPPAVLALALGPRDRAARLGVYALAFATAVFVVIQGGRTKLPWYDAQLYPALALVLGVGFSRVVRAVARARRPADASGVVPRRSALRQAAIVALVFAFPVATNLALRERDLLAEHVVADDAKLRYGQYFARLRDAGKLASVQVVDNGFGEGWKYNSPLHFYATLANARGASIAVVAPDSLLPGRLVVSCDETAWRAATAGRASETVDEWNECKAARLSPPQGEAPRAPAAAGRPNGS